MSSQGGANHLKYMVKRARISKKTSSRESYCSWNAPLDIKAKGGAVAVTGRRG